MVLPQGMDCTNERSASQDAYLTGEAIFLGTRDDGITTRDGLH